MKFPHDAPQRRVLKTPEALGFHVVRTGNPDGTTTPLTMPNHSKLKGPTLRSICTQAGIPRRVPASVWAGV